MRAIDYFDKGAELAPDRTAITDGTRGYRYRDVREASWRIARALHGAGLRGEQAAAIYAPNDPLVLFCLLGLMRAGAVWIPVNARNALDANLAYLRYVRTHWLFYHSAYAADVARLKRELPELRQAICLDQPLAGDLSLDEFMALGDAAGVPDSALDWSDPFGSPERRVGIFATGGTTGPAKGMNVTNLGWGTMLEIQYHYWRRDEVTEPVCLSSAPLTHAAGVVALASCTFGATNVILPRFDAGEFLSAIERHRVTHTFLPPTALYALLDHPDLPRHDYSSLRIFLLAGSPVAPERFKRAVEVFGPCLCQSYGQVESPMILTWLPPEVVARAATGDHPERLASCGRASYPVQVSVMADDGRLLGPGEVGEIVARGRLISHSYFELPEETAAIRRFGWHHTGDVGYRDADGFIYIVDRKKDMIVTGGFNVFSAEVEAAILELREVSDCAVIGIPDDTWGEAVTAIVVTATGASIAEAAVIAHCKQRLGGVKAPKSVTFRDALPKTPAGKTDKKALRAPYWAGQSRAVG
ncbi:MAG: AMP-binding protein [Gammaproteobacteria bacterium]|nr:AMP-binding protein [Gammaproteobacteria bacterium]